MHMRWQNEASKSVITLTNQKPEKKTDYLIFSAQNGLLQLK